MYDLTNNSSWNVVMYLFNEHDKLQRYFTNAYFNMDAQIIDQKALLKVSKPWSRSEQFILKLALHLYNSSIKIDLNDMDCLDANNKKLVKEALFIRFRL